MKSMTKLNWKQSKKHCNLHELIAGVKDLLVNLQLNTRAGFSWTFQHCLQDKKQ